MIINNTCSKTYKPNPEKIIKKIVKLIPHEYLKGIVEINIFDNQSNKSLNIENIFIDKTHKLSIIEVNMDNPDFSGLPFFSILSLNIDFINAVNYHYFKTNDNHSEFKRRVRYNWMYLGIWSPVKGIFNLLNFLFKSKDNGV